MNDDLPPNLWLWAAIVGLYLFFDKKIGDEIGSRERWDSFHTTGIRDLEAYTNIHAEDDEEDDEDWED